EIAADRGRAVNLEGFKERMEEQRRRAREARAATGVGAGAAGDGAAAVAPVFADLLDASGPNEFVGYAEPVSTTRVVALLDGTESIGRAEAPRLVDVILDRTPFYAESGGQVGDTGSIETADGALRVLDTVYAVPGKLILHRA